MKLFKIELALPVAAISAFFLFVLSASAGTYYVSHTGAGGNPGTEESPVDTIAAALALCVSGDDEIVIEKSDTPYIADNISVAKAVTIRSATGEPEDVVVRSTSGSKVRVFSLNHAKAKLYGLTISDGFLKSNLKGAGVSIGSDGGVVEKCVIRNCVSNEAEKSGTNGGSAVYINGPGRVSNCVITNNMAGCRTGYGAVRMLGNGLVENCFVAYNYTQSEMTGPEIMGSGIYAENGTVANCTVYRNRGAWSAGVHVTSDCKGVYNCLIYDNEGGRGGKDGMRDVCTGDSSKFHNCAARVKINDSCVAVGYLSSADEMMRPVAGSPLADAGVIVAAAVSATDLDGNARTKDGKIDIGCFQFSTSPAAAKPSVGMTISKLATLKSKDEEIVFEFHGNVSGTASWNFGDGSLDTGAEVRHVYTSYGKFYPSVTVDGTSYTAKKPVLVLPDTMYVSLNNANAAWPYENGSNAAKTVLEALDAAVVDGIEIVVANGTYQSAKTPFLKYGVTVRSASGTPSDVTIQSPGKNNIRGPHLDHENARIVGVTVDNGTESSGWGHVAYGIGVYLSNGGGTVSNCVIKNVYPSGRQFSAVHVLNGKGLVTHTKMTGCTTGETNDIGVFYLQGGGRGDNCLLIGNSKSTQSGAKLGAVVVMDGSDDNLLRNCTIVGNKMAAVGGVMVSKGSVVNCVIAGNTASQSTYRNYKVGQESHFDHCATDDAVAINTNCSIGELEALFADYAGGDYTPKSGGPIFNAGLNPDPCEATDYAGNKRISGGTIDIGAYEADAETFDFEVLSDAQAVVVPADVEYWVGFSGTNGTDVFRCYWSFDGGATYEATENKIVKTYQSVASNDVTVIVSNLTTSVGTTKTKTGAVRSLPKTMYVVSGANAGSAWPYDTWEKAATSFNVVVAEAIDSMEIVCSNGTHWTSSDATRIGKALLVRGVSGRPEDVVLKAENVAYHNCTWSFTVDHAKAVVKDLVLESKDGQGCCTLRIDKNGGMVSNCVIRLGNANNDSTPGGAAYLVGENSLLTHCVITNNIEDGKYGDSPGNHIVSVSAGRVSNCLLVGNKIKNAKSNALCVLYASANGTVDNCTVVGNDVTGIGRHVAASSNATLANCIVAENTFAGESACIVADGPYQNFVTDETTSRAAIFVEPAAGNWHLSSKALGVAINRGTEDFGKDLPAVDLDGNPRKVGPRVDIGCYESPIQPGLMMMVK